jgi:hypothetical protein
MQEKEGFPGKAAAWKWSPGGNLTFRSLNTLPSPGLGKEDEFCEEVREGVRRVDRS